MGARKRGEGAKEGVLFVVAGCNAASGQIPRGGEREKRKQCEKSDRQKKTLAAQSGVKIEWIFFIVMYLLRRGGRISSTTSVVLLQRRLCAKTHRWWGGVCSSRVLCEYANTMCVPRMCAKKQA